MNKLIIPEGHEIRAELIRLYLEPEHPAILAQLQDEVRNVTNHIVRSRQDVKNACVAYALRNGLVGPAPVFPESPCPPTPQSPEERQQVKAVWDEFYRQEKAAGVEYGKWLSTVFAAVKEIPECGWRKDKYQDLRGIYGRVGAAVLYRDTVKRVNGTKSAKPKRRSDPVPLVWSNSPFVETGSFYGDRQGIPFYNALVKVPGIKKPFLGRLRRPLPGKPIQGVTLTKKADGWYAAIKCIVPKRQLPEPVLPPVGVDVGQTDLVALSDGYTECNPRDTEFVAVKAAIQEFGDRSGNANIQTNCRSRVARMDQSRKRRIAHWINSELLPRLQRHSYVFVERLVKGFKSDKGPLSCMHVILDAIKLRLGDRVKEVNPAYTSQTCSCCGNDTDIIRKGKVFTCLASECGVVLDADINAARNILANGMELLAA